MTAQPPIHWTLLGLAFGLGMPAKATAGFYANGTTSEQTLAYGARFAGRALAFRINVPGVGTGQRNTSATFLNSRFALTAAHSINDLLAYNPRYEVADGTNFLTDRGNVMAVTSVRSHPSLDLAILTFAASFHAAPDQTIGSALVGDVTYLAGFGRWGTPAITPPAGVPPQDGGLRGWDAQVWDASLDAPYKQQAGCGFYAINPGLLTIAGRGMSGDSGGPVFTSNGELVGVIVTGHTHTYMMDGSTGFISLGEPATKAWIEANTALPAALPDLRLSTINNGTDMRLTWDAAATGFRLQTSETLSGWAYFGDLLTGPGSLDEPVTADRPRRYYRLAKP